MQPIEISKSNYKKLYLDIERIKIAIDSGSYETKADLEKNLTLHTRWLESFIARFEDSKMDYLPLLVDFREWSQRRLEAFK